MPASHADITHDVLLRIEQIIGTAAAKPHKAKYQQVRREAPFYEPIFPVGRSTWYAGVRSGRYPAPVKLSERCSAWKKSEIDELINNLGEKIKNAR